MRNVAIAPSRDGVMCQQRTFYSCIVLEPSRITRSIASDFMRNCIITSEYRYDKISIQRSTAIQYLYVSCLHALAPSAVVGNIDDLSWFE